MHAFTSSWLFSHLSAGLVLGGVLMFTLLFWRGASTAHVCRSLAVFLAMLAAVTPFQQRIWPEVAIPVSKTVLKPSVVESMPSPISSSKASSISAVSPEAIGSPVSSHISLADILGAIWLMGVLILLARLFIGVWFWRRLWASAREIETPPTLDSQVSLRLSDAVRTPMSSGKQILMPSDWQKWPLQDQTAALEHELAHVRHHDGFTRWIAALATALHWPSPFVWLAERRLRLAQEQRCDEDVLAGGADATAYGRLLLRCAQKAGSAPVWLTPTVTSMARPGQLASRIEHLAHYEPLSRPTLLWHLLWPLLLACACLQCLHVRLVAEDKPSDMTKRDEIVIEIKFIESNSQSDLPKGQSAANKQRKLLTTELNKSFRNWMKRSDTKITAYPRMVTRSDNKVIFRSVVKAEEGHEATIDSVGRSGLEWAGTIAEFTPHVTSKGIELEGGLGFNEVTKRLKNGHAEHTGQKAMLQDIVLAIDETLVLGPFQGKAAKGDGKRPVMWAFITARNAKDESLENVESERLKGLPSKKYSIQQTSIYDLIRLLVADAGVQYISSTIDDQAFKLPKIDFNRETNPFAALERLCSENKLRLRQQGSMWIIDRQGDPEGPFESLDAAAIELRAAPSQRYDFASAGARDVLRFIATDAGISFIGPNDQSPNGDKPISFSLEACPFRVIEQVCGVLDLQLIRHGDIWHLREHNEPAVLLEPLDTPEAKKLRDQSPQQYDFSKANFSDVLRFLANDAGIKCSMSKEDPKLNTPVTFSINAAPFSVIENICAARSIQLTLNDGLLQIQ